ncbi:MAG: hypothetical protein BIP78_0796 [Candidatus Bipolaricaulis sibiricus]|uniref:ABC transporter permease n=1 Tax=Bipolaricaulis sibiricus TaxID=2501609 RepID=A0A410FUA8_BIPS1|nr:MAG: hypothetical protein BIP78_0796 [Candidatus Bipolaricaulis sibiricus]
MWIVWANARRRKARFVMTVAGIAVGVATLFALLASSAGIQRGLEREIGGLGAHILLLPVGCPYTLTLALMQGTDTLDYIPQERLAAVRAVDNVRLALPVVVGRVRVNGEMTPIYGATDDILYLKRWGGTRFDGAVVGSDAAARLGLTVGSRITLSLYAQDELAVIRILPRTGGRDDTFVFIPLEVAQRVLALQNELSAVLIQTEAVDRVAQTRQALGRLPHLQAVPPSEVFDMLVGLFGSVASTLMLITGVAIVVGVLTTMNTMTMAVYERRAEIGLLRAVGATRGDVFRLFLVESLWVALLAGAVGVGGGYVATQLLPRTTGFGLAAAPHFSPSYIGISLLVAAGVGSAAALYPAWMAAQTEPIQALRAP